MLSMYGSFEPAAGVIANDRAAGAVQAVDVLMNADRAIAVSTRSC